MSDVMDTMTTWEDQMSLLCSTATYFATCNVIDINFENGEQYEVYVAISPEERQRGLSDVASIDLDGMLFVYDSPSYVPFSMTAMLIDLDVAWYDATGRLIKLGTYTAGSTQPLTSPEPFSYVLEAPAGTLGPVNLKVRN